MFVIRWLRAASIASLAGAPITSACSADPPSAIQFDAGPGLSASGSASGDAESGEGTSSDAASGAHGTTGASSGSGTAETHGSGSNPAGTTSASEAGDDADEGDDGDTTADEDDATNVDDDGPPGDDDGDDSSAGAGLHPLLVPADPAGAVCMTPGYGPECPLGACRFFDASSGRCESCTACGNLNAFCTTGTDCDILFACFAGRCTNFCTLGTFECGAPSDCVDVGHPTHGVCDPFAS